MVEGINLEGEAFTTTNSVCRDNCLLRASLGCEHAKIIDTRVHLPKVSARVEWNRLLRGTWGHHCPNLRNRDKLGNYLDLLNNRLGWIHWPGIHSKVSSDISGLVGKL